MTLKIDNQALYSSRIAVLGAGGFLGQRLVESLQADNIAVLALTSRDLDLSAPAAGSQLAGLLQPGDVVVFLAAVTPDKGRNSAVLMRNLAMGQAVCTASKICRPTRLIYASSDAVYPFTSNVISEASEAAPVDLYGAMHRAREIMMTLESETLLAVLRFTAVYGRGDTHNSYGPNRFVAQAFTEKKISLFGNGEETRDHLYIDDAVAILRRVIASGATGLLNVASGSSISFRAIAEMIAASQPNVDIETSPRKAPVTHRRFNIANTQAAFPDIRFTAIEAGLRATLAGYSPA